MAIVLFGSCRRLVHGGDHCVCRIDGEKFKNKDKTLMFGSGSLNARLSGNCLLIECDDQKGGEAITIRLCDSTTRNNESGKFKLSGIPISTYGYYGNSASYSNNSNSLSNRYNTDAQNTGTVKVRFGRGRITGSFSFKAKYSAGTGDDVEVTNGSFSIPLE